LLGDLLVGVQRAPDERVEGGETVPRAKSAPRWSSWMSARWISC